MNSNKINYLAPATAAVTPITGKKGLINVSAVAKTFAKASPLSIVGKEKVVTSLFDSSVIATVTLKLYIDFLINVTDSVTGKGSKNRLFIPFSKE